MKKREPADAPGFDIRLDRSKSDRELDRIAERSRIQLSTLDRHEFLSAKRKTRRYRNKRTERLQDEMDLLHAGRGIFKPGKTAISLTRYYRYARESGFSISMRDGLDENGVEGCTIFRNDMSKEDREAAKAFSPKHRTPRTAEREKREIERKAKSKELKAEYLEFGPEVDLIVESDKW